MRLKEGVSRECVLGPRTDVTEECESCSTEMSDDMKGRGGRGVVEMGKVLECNLTYEQVREVSVIKGDFEVFHHTMSYKPRRGKFVGEARVIVKEGWRVGVQGGVAVCKGARPVSK